jgi:hypothetical protein
MGQSQEQESGVELMHRLIAKIIHFQPALKRRQIRGEFRLILSVGLITIAFSGWFVLAESGEELWGERTRPVGGREGQRYFTLNREGLAALLIQVRPAEAGEAQVELPLPLPDGSTIRFLIAETPVLEPALAEKYPEIRTYSGRASDDPTTTMRGILTPQGFEAMVLKPDRLITIHPGRAGNGQSTLSGYYVSSDEQMTQNKLRPIRCEVRDDGVNVTQDLLREENQAGRAVSIGGTLRTYRIALGATWEYAERFGGGTVAGTVAAMAGLLNRANGIYERELAIRFQLVDAPSLIYSAEQGFSAGSDPFTAGSMNANLTRFGQIMLLFGNDRYDIGHLLDWGASGVANVGVACRNPLFAGEIFKALGVSALSHDLGDKGNLNLFAHELGHQFGAKHSFNGTVSTCGFSGERAADTAFEPGSGSTVMSYGGLCESDNLTSYASGSIRFHFGSIAQIINYIETTGNCFNSQATSNNPPVVDGGLDYTIPRRTPFELQATGSDPDVVDRLGLTYVWEQIDPGLIFPNPPYTDRDDSPDTTRPIFRSYEPSTSRARFFPSREYILNSANTPPEMSGGYRVAESLPNIGRVLNFGVMLRDNRPGGSGLSIDRVALTVAPNAGPFTITSPNAPVEWATGTDQPIQWDVAGTDLSPVNCAQVQIALSIDGGETFPIILLAVTPNDGQQIVRIPAGTVTTRARIRVAAVGNIFFDINDADLTIRRGELAIPTRPLSGSSATPRPSRPAR